VLWIYKSDYTILHTEHGAKMVLNINSLMEDAVAVSSNTVATGGLIREVAISALNTRSRMRLGGLPSPLMPKKRTPELSLEQGIAIKHYKGFFVLFAKALLCML
jgi:hypothetical protein